MVEEWELDLIKGWSTSTIKDYIWLAVDCGQPVPGCVSVEALRTELRVVSETIGKKQKFNIA